MSVKEKLNQESMMKVLDTCYEKCLNGIPVVSPTVEKMATDYTHKNNSIETAAKSMINNQIAKCTTSGFLTGFGGAITLPVTIPANVGSVLYVQMRMIACTAYIAGYDLNSDQVQTLVYACLAGVSITEVIKKVSVKFGEKFANNLIEKIPGKVLTKINQKVGMRFVTKFGEKGIINLVKLIPAVGALINGGLDLFETKAIGNRAYKLFIEKDATMGMKKKGNDDTDYIEVEVEDSDFS